MAQKSNVLKKLPEKQQAIKNIAQEGDTMPKDRMIVHEMGTKGNKDEFLDILASAIVDTILKDREGRNYETRVISNENEVTQSNGIPNII